MHIISNSIIFATTNKNKLKKAAEVLFPIEIRSENFKDSIIEIQTDNHEELIKHKLSQVSCIARKKNTPVMVDDFGLYIKNLGGFPSTSTKQVIKQMGLINFVKLFGNYYAEMRCFLGLIMPDGTQLYSSGSLRGKIKNSVNNVPVNGAELSSIFIPEGGQTSLSEMPKDFVDHRHMALLALKYQLN